VTVAPTPHSLGGPTPHSLSDSDVAAAAGLVAVVAAVCDLCFEPQLACRPPLFPSLNFICSSKCLASSAFPSNTFCCPADNLFQNIASMIRRASGSVFLSSEPRGLLSFLKSFLVRTTFRSFSHQNEFFCV